MSNKRYDQFPAGTYNTAKIFLQADAVTGALEKIFLPAIPSTGIPFAITTGTTNYIVSFTPPFTSYTRGMTIAVSFTVSNPFDYAFLNVDGLGLKSILNSDGATLGSGNLPLNGICILSYDGTNFRVIAGFRISEYVKTTGDYAFSGTIQTNGNLFVNSHLYGYTLVDSGNFIIQGGVSQYLFTNAVYQELGKSTYAGLGFGGASTKQAATAFNSAVLIIGKSKWNQNTFANDIIANVMILTPSVANGTLVKTFQCLYLGDAPTGAIANWSLNAGKSLFRDKIEVQSTTTGSHPFPNMTAAQKAAIAAPAVGDCIFQTDGVEGIYVYKSDGTWHFVA